MHAVNQKPILYQQDAVLEHTHSNSLKNFLTDNKQKRKLNRTLF